MRQSYKDLVAWKKAMGLVTEVYQLTCGFWELGTGNRELEPGTENWALRTENWELGTVI